MVDYYETLGVGRDASREEIKKAYKRMAKKYHPDLNKEADAEQQFKAVNEAAAVLGDEEKRRQYDSVGHEGFTDSARGGGFSSQGYSANTDFGDIFENFFGGGFSDIFGGTRRSTRGADLRYDLTVTLEEAAFGSKKELSLRKQSTCDHCKGSGGERSETCTTCHGHGTVRQTRRTPFGIFQTTGACPKCEGEGNVILEPCTTCDGTGVVLETKKLEIDIPPGVDAGTRLRVNSEGEAGKRGSKAGDLYVFISVKEHALFERHGSDIHLEAPISFFQAVFGASIEVPILGGKAKVKIPAGTQSGTLFRLRAKGVPFLHHHGQGDQLVTVQVETPEKLTKKQRQLLEQTAKEFGDSASPEKGLFKKLKEKLS